MSVCIKHTRSEGGSIDSGVQKSSLGLRGETAWAGFTLFGSPQTHGGSHFALKQNRTARTLGLSSQCGCPPFKSSSNTLSHNVSPHLLALDLRGSRALPSASRRSVENGCGALRLSPCKLAMQKAPRFRSLPLPSGHQGGGRHTPFPSKEKTSPGLGRWRTDRSSEAFRSLQVAWPLSP